ncbi:MAG: 2-succinyl-5-enolpyruvyl-6-hydroxy-3-cyclohexene-1-carboxylic-acid synthase [Bacteroidetes bacterium]|nr:2-succinyl-5-enolpyruvyl-6-hydroxy-3-cyclohexene-1-carboxylic-acid synthase [Flavobacteriales bacterium]NCG30634.1 2-succinyl-5-enolpyruvyl-6-hydroxy-3-cyclohexene-1-carboxylic-acid synthase [Bacteroidota bacterium]
MTKISSIESVQSLVQLAEMKGVCDVVISPGSRNAPLILSFTSNAYFNCQSVLDERTAGFVALGMSQSTGKPTMLSCTSGSAVVNYAPALAEAYYQKIPLIAITADRPKHLIDQGEGQSMRQEGVMDNFLEGSFNLVEEKSKDDAALNEQLINQAFDLAIATSKPVQINVPLSEPLYDMVEQPTAQPKDLKDDQPRARLDDSTFESLKNQWKASNKVLILVSQFVDRGSLEQTLGNLCNNPKVAVLTETTANMYNLGFVSCIDRTLELFEGGEDELQYIPDLLITVGENIISKKIKTIIRKHKANIQKHWHFGDVPRDTFQCLTELIKVNPGTTLSAISSEQDAIGEFGMRWRNAFYKAENVHKEFMASLPFSDLKVIEQVLDFIPDASNLQMGNSSVVRYIQLFNQIRTIKYHGNRGLSGIEGCTSTAAGMAIMSQNNTVLVSGDQAFRYDSNGLSLHESIDGLKVIVINNSGGNIFRIIPGPNKHVASERFIEKMDERSIQKLVDYHGCDYQSARNEESLETGLRWLFDPTSTKNEVLEVFTPRLDNPEILKAYFSKIKGVDAQ